MTTEQIISEAKKEIKKQCKPNTVKSIEVAEMAGGYSAAKVVVIPAGSEGEDGAETWNWEFLIDYNEGNADCFTKLQRYEFPNLLIEPSVTVKYIS